MYMSEYGREGFRRHEEVRVRGLTNRQLFDELLHSAAGDDYGGCFSDKGEITFLALKEETQIRLMDWMEE